jgi:hypothetical protein
MNWVAASLLLLRTPVRPRVKSKDKIKGKSKDKIKGSGQECPLHTSNACPSGEHVAYAFDLGAYGFQFFFDFFVAAVDVVDAVDNGFAIGY